MDTLCFGTTAVFSDFRERIVRSDVEWKDLNDHLKGPFSLQTVKQFIEWFVFGLNAGWTSLCSGQCFCSCDFKGFCRYEKKNYKFIKDGWYQDSIIFQR